MQRNHNNRIKKLRFIRVIKCRLTASNLIAYKQCTTMLAYLCNVIRYRTKQIMSYFWVLFAGKQESKEEKS